jgi:hypothetical protein
MRPRISQVYASLGHAAQCGRWLMLEESSWFVTCASRHFEVAS